jgi:hypothetical protein
MFKEINKLITYDDDTSKSYIFILTLLIINKFKNYYSR